MCGLLQDLRSPVKWIPDCSVRYLMCSVHFYRRKSENPLDLVYNMIRYKYKNYKQKYTVDPKYATPVHALTEIHIHIQTLLQFLQQLNHILTFLTFVQMKPCGDMEMDFQDKTGGKEEEASPLQGKVVAEVNGDGSIVMS